MGKSHNIKTTAEYSKYAADVKNLRRDKKKKVTKHKDYGDDY